MTVVILTFYKAVEVYLDDSIQTFLKENKILLTTLHADSVFCENTQIKEDLGK